MCDLARGCCLAALPAPAEDGASLAALLAALFLEHGPPLVLKSDNGACRSDEVEKLLKRYHVQHLLSPPLTQRYNASIEAGFGGIKTEAHWEAARHDRPGQWTADDVEAARRRANETHRPWGIGQPTPAAAWESRTPIEPEERFGFLESAVWAYRERSEDSAASCPAYRWAS